MLRLVDHARPRGSHARPERLFGEASVQGQAARHARGRQELQAKVARFWEIWPMPDVVDEAHRVVYFPGIYLARDLVVLIACSDEHVLSWRLARSEASRTWIALLSRIAAP